MTEGDNRKQLAPKLKIGLDAYCQSELLSEEGLHELIELYGLEPNNNHCDDYHFFLRACYNGNFTEGIIRCLLEYFPDAANATDEDGMTPLHCACDNKSATLNIIQLLVEAAPESVRSVDNVGNIALHYLCENNENEVDETDAVQILKFLLDKHPEAVRHADNRGNLPIHCAAQKRSPEFCRVLIDAYPGSDRIADANGVLPLHYACFKGSLETVEYLYSLYREAIHHDTPGGYPINAVIVGTQYRGNPAVAVEVVQFLLNRDPNQKQFDGEPLLQSACRGDYDDSNIKAAIQVIKILFDVKPEAIEENGIASNIHRCHQQVQAFINGELVYARQAKDLRHMTTPDDNGQLPLHVALQNNVRLGSIKLLVKGNPAAVLSPDNSSALPLHSACQHHDSASVVSYLVGLDPSTLDAVDREGNTALHLACRGAKYETITLLLEKYDAVSVSKRNHNKKLPIDLLWESTAVENRESIEYTGSVFQLLRAYPEILMNDNVKDMTQQAEVGVSSSHNAKKRKRGTVEK